MQCFMKKKDKSLLDIENVETAGVLEEEEETLFDPKSANVQCITLS